MADLAPYDNAITELFTFLAPLSTAFVAMITDRLAINKSKREQRSLDRRIRKVQKQITEAIYPGLSIAQNAAMIKNKVELEFSQDGDTLERQTLIINQFCFELLHIPIPVTVQ